MTLKDYRAWRIRKKSLQVYDQNSTLPAISPEMPCQMLLEPLKLPVQPFSFLTGSIVRNHAWRIERNQNLVAEGLVNLSVCL